MKTIIFGPWTGEFSYEIQWWLSEIREVALNEKCKTVMVGLPGREALYRDFIDEYIEFPESLLQYCSNPNCWAQRARDSRRLYIPEEILSFYYSVCTNYDNVVVYHPTANLIDKRFLETPPGIFKNIERYDEKVEVIVNDILSKFKHDRTICIVPKLRLRDGVNIDHETWPIDIWEQIIDICIHTLNLNVISFLFKTDSTTPGTYDFAYLQDKYANSFYQIDLKCENSLDIQIALLQNTNFSIYGSTGAAVLPIMCNTKMITFQVKEAGWRLNFDWQKKLSDNHKYIRIRDKYTHTEYKHMTIDEICTDIINYVNDIKK